MLASWLLGVATLLAAVVPSSALVYWPVHTPTETSPWVVGQPNSLIWSSGGDTGIPVFDIQLHNNNKKIMVGFIELAQRVPMRKFSSGSLKGTYGGQLAIDLGADCPTGDGFSLIFLDTAHGQVYAKSHKFSIYPASQQPSNYTTATLPDGTPQTTVTITELPNQTQQYLITLDGVVPQTAAA